MPFLRLTTTSFSKPKKEHALRFVSSSSGINRLHVVPCNFGAQTALAPSSDLLFPIAVLATASALGAGAFAASAVAAAAVA